MSKASGGDEIPVELFQMLKDDAVKVLHSIYQQIWKTQQWPEDWKSSVFIPIPKKGNAKECSNYHTISLISHASKVMLKIFQARLQQYVNHELPDVQAGFRKGRGTRDCQLLKNFPQCVVIHRVKGFGIVSKAEVDVFLKLSWFLTDPRDIGHMISGSSAFSKSSLNIWKFGSCTVEA